VLYPFLFLFGQSIGRTERIHPPPKSPLAPRLSADQDRIVFTLTLDDTFFAALYCLFKQGRELFL
jgi:hypothetical protein